MSQSAIDQHHAFAMGHQAYFWIARAAVLSMLTSRQLYSLSSGLYNIRSHWRPLLAVFGATARALKFHSKAYTNTGAILLPCMLVPVAIDAMKRLLLMSIAQHPELTVVSMPATAMPYLQPLCYTKI
jgi:hypothetical protein